MKRAKWRDTAQNIIITLLSLSAVILFSQTQFFHLGTTTGRSYFQISSPGINAAVPAISSDTLSAPVRLVITDEYRHSGSVTLTTTDETFQPWKTLMSEVLGSAHTPVTSNRETFANALQQPSVFYDFLHSLPLRYLAGQCDAGTSFDLSVRYLLISQQLDGIHLFLWDGGDQFLRSATALQIGSLPLISEQYAFDRVYFPSELETAQQLSLGTIFPETLPDLKTLSAASPVRDADSLLAAFQFNPHTNSRYTEAGGSEVVIDGDRTLRLQPDGSVIYQGGSQGLLRIATASSAPDVQEIAAGVYAFLGQLAFTGDAQLYVESIQPIGNGFQLTFGYQLCGVPIRQSGSRQVAIVNVVGNAITSLSFTPRQYVVTEAASCLLPLTQAIAVATAQTNSSLYIGYADYGGDTVSAAWLAG